MNDARLSSPKRIGNKCPIRAPALVVKNEVGSGKISPKSAAKLLFFPHIKRINRVLVP